MTLTQYLLQIPRPVFGQEVVNEVVLINELTELSDQVIKKVEARIELPFVPKMEGNLCFIQNQEVLPAFRTSFDDMQLLDVFYACSLSSNSSSISLDFLPFPTNTDSFWELSEYGRQLRVLHTLNFELPHWVFPLIANSASKKEAKMDATYPLFQKIPTQGTGNIWVNAQNYFSEVPKAVWDFKIHQRFPAREALQMRLKTSLTQNIVLGHQKRLSAIKQSLSLVNKINRLSLSDPLV